MNSLSRGAALCGAAGSMIIALTHAGMILVGPKAYDFFRAGDQMVELARSGSILPAAITSIVAITFAVFAMATWQFSQRPNTWFRRAVLAIGLIYSLRGAALFVQIPGWVPESEVRDIVFSAISLTIGLCHLFASVKSAPVSRL